MTDFDFATRVQALLVSYYRDSYIDRLGKQQWNAQSEQQRMALIAMLRDVYTPNIGRMSDNLYTLPEFNCAPFDYVAKELEKVKMMPESMMIWWPDHPEYLWAGATFKLRALAEVWQTATGTRFGDNIRPSNTLQEALPLLYRFMSRVQEGM